LPLSLLSCKPRSSKQHANSRQTIGIHKTGCISPVSIVHSIAEHRQYCLTGMELTTQKRTMPTALASKRMHSPPEVSPHRIPSEDTKVSLTGDRGRSGRQQTGRSKLHTRGRREKHRTTVRCIRVGICTKSASISTRRWLH
jgi:hypothetical protein